MTATIGVITFPGTLDDVDAARAARTAGAEVKSLWHADSDLHGVDAVVVPGGFSYGDYPVSYTHLTLPTILLV